MIIKIITVLVMILIFPAFSGASEMEEYHGPEITVQYEAPLKTAARQIGSDYRKTKTEIEAKLGLQLSNESLVVLMRDHNAFQDMARNKLVTAFAMPERNLVVIDYSRMNRIPFDLEDTFKHELTHILLHQKIPPSSLPKWLDEGVAQWASGGMADILHTGEKDLLQQAVLSHHLMPLVDISSAFPDSPRGLMLAYEESKSFVEYIVHHYGEAKLRSLLHSLAKQGTIEQAVYDNYGVSLDILEQIWKKTLSREISWISYAADHLIWVLFFFAAVVTVAGYCVVKRRIKNYRDDGDEAEVKEADGQPPAE